MRVIPLWGRGMGSNSYLVTDEASCRALLIDPSVSVSDAASMYGGALPEIAEIILTHAHADHMLFLDEWRRYCGAPVSVGLLDAHAMSNPEASCAYYLGLGARSYGAADKILRDGDEVRLGDETLRVLSTPGHTPGSICLLSDREIITGDTIFADGGVGRCDFFGGSEDALVASLRYLLRLSGDLIVYPGHGPATTVQKEAMIHSYLM